MEIILLVILAVLVLWFFMTYNKFVKLIEAVTNSEKAISLQLDQRGKKFDSLISTVNKIIEHENSVFTKVAELRTQTRQGKAVENNSIQKAEDELSKIVTSGELQSSLNITMEAYPELKSDKNMLQFQEEIVFTENKLTFSKKAFNNAIETYNIKKKSIPDLIVPKIISSLNKDFEYWSLSEEEIKVQEDKRVEF